MKCQMRSLSYKSKITFMCCFANIFISVDRVLISLAFAPIAHEANWNITQIGFIITSYGLGFFISHFMCNKLMEYMGGRNLLLVIVFSWAVPSCLILLFATSLSVMIVSRCVIGFTDGLVMPTINWLFNKHILSGDRSSGFASVTLAGILGNTCGSIWIPWLTWYATLEILVALEIIWVIAWFLLIHEPPLVLNPLLDVEHFQDDETASLTPSQCLRGWSYWAIYIAHFAMNWAGYIIINWLPFYLAYSLGIRVESLWVISMPYLLSGLFAFVWTSLANKMVIFGWPLLRIRRTMTAFGLVIPGIFLLILPEAKGLFTVTLTLSCILAFTAACSCGHLLSHFEVAPNQEEKTFRVSSVIASIPAVLCGPVVTALVIASHGRWFPVFLLAGTIDLTAAVIYYAQSSDTSIL